MARHLAARLRLRSWWLDCTAAWPQTDSSWTSAKSAAGWYEYDPESGWWDWVEAPRSEVRKVRWGRASQHPHARPQPRHRMEQRATALRPQDWSAHELPVLVTAGKLQECLRQGLCRGSWLIQEPCGIVRNHVSGNREGKARKQRGTRQELPATAVENHGHRDLVALSRKFTWRYS